MKKLFAFVIFLLLVHKVSFSQYANSGTGALKNDIWWFNWANMNLLGNAGRTVTTPDGLTITYTLITQSAPTASIMNTWSGAVLHFLYDFTNPAIQPALYQYLSGGNSLSFNLNVKVTRNGLPVPFTLIAVDAEASTQNEITTFTSNAGPWQIVDFYRNSFQTTNPVSGCNTNTVKLSDTYGNAAATGQNPVLASAATAGDITINTVMDHRVNGGMAVAFGIMAPVDRGDLPASYGYAYHELTYSINNGCNYLPPLPSATNSQTLKLGAVSGDADGTQTLDDNASGVDEDGLSSFPVYYNNGTYSLPVTLNNATGSDAYLTGWFDYNRNGVFDNGESVTLTVPNNAATATLTWNGLPTWLAQGAVTDYAVRLRLSTDKAAAQSATGFAKDGEVEDYTIPAQTLCNISIHTVNDTTVCAGQPVPLNATGTNTLSYSWDQPTYLSDAAIANPVAHPGATITYTVTGSNPQGCTARDLVTLSVMPGPVIAINNNTSICNGTTVQLSAGAAGALSYTWWPQAGLDNSAIPTPMASPAATTTYVVQVKDGNGCIAEDSVKITLLPPPGFAVSPATAVVCENDMVQLSASGGDEYTWLSPNNTLLGKTASISVQATTSQTYRVIIKENVCNNSDTRSIPVTVNSRPTPAITKSNDIDCSVGQAVLHVTGGVSYLWNTMPGIKDTTSANPVVMPPQTTTYLVTVTNSRGCTAQDSVTVTADFAKALSAYPVPSAFTPNNDGRNDCFGLKLWGQVTKLQFQVFNRWGHRVFATTDPAQCWDGTYNGEPQPAGGYAYTIKAVTRCGTVNRTGMVILIR